MFDFKPIYRGDAWNFNIAFIFSKSVWRIEKKHRFKTVNGMADPVEIQNILFRPCKTFRGILDDFLQFWKN